MADFTYVTVRLTAAMLADLDALAAADADNSLRPVRRPDVLRKALAEMIATRRPTPVARPRIRRHAPAA